MFPLDAHTAHTDQVFEGLVMRQAHILANEFYDCTFKSCHFNETTFDRCRFVHCTFKHCDLSLARVTASSLTETRFENSKLVGVDWTEANWGLLGSIGFLGCTINYAIFTDLDLRRTRIEKCVAHEADFRGTNLGGANLTHTDFWGSFFKHTVLESADLSHAQNYKIDVNLNKIKGAKFTLPEATSLLYSLDIVLVE